MRRLIRWLHRITGETWIYFLAFQHLLWGAALFVSPTPLLTTGINTLLQFLPQYTAATGFIFCALLSLWGMSKPPNYQHFVIMLPQMAILFLSAGGAINVIVQGHYYDLGVGEIPRLFLLVDQWQHAGFMLMYVLSVAKHFGLLGKVLPV